MVNASKVSGELKCVHIHDWVKVIENTVRVYVRGTSRLREPRLYAASRPFPPRARN